MRRATQYLMYMVIFFYDLGLTDDITTDRYHHTSSLLVEYVTLKQDRGHNAVNTNTTAAVTEKKVAAI
jgi:hypothetical protein